MKDCYFTFECVFFNLKQGLRLGIIVMAFGSLGLHSLGSEYEVRGRIIQTIYDPNAAALRTTNDFTVFARDCGWLIQTVENDGKGNVLQREMGTTNGIDICDCNGRVALINGDGIPVELADEGVDGHLWLMFASQCYWGDLHSDRLTPVYDWHASVGANPQLKVKAEWDLLDGPGSLPREVRYYGNWDETNGFYKISGTQAVGRLLIATGFTFEERHVGGRAANSLVDGIYLRKRVEAAVTSVQAVCSRKSLLPVWSGKTLIIDWRLKAQSAGNNVPSYFYSSSGLWPTVDDAKKLFADQHPKHLQEAAQSTKLVELHRTPVLIALVCCFLLGPLVIYFTWRKPWKISRTS